jgi:hypothetical protein
VDRKLDGLGVLGLLATGDKLSKLLDAFGDLVATASFNCGFMSA